LDEADGVLMSKMNRGVGLMVTKQEEKRYDQESDTDANSEQHLYLLPSPEIAGKKYVWDFGGWVAVEPLIEK